MAIRLPGTNEVPPGALRDFVVALHELYDQAGQPAARLISKDIYALPRHLENVSHQTVSSTLHGTAVPAWNKVRSIVIALARRGESTIDEKELDLRFKQLWVKSRASLHPQAGQEPPDEADPALPAPARPEVQPTLPLAPGVRPARSLAAIHPEEVPRLRIDRPTPPPAELVIGGLPDRDGAFTGREELLERMRTELLNNPHTPLVLHGMSGVGKSQLAREYVERHLAHHRITWWVQAEHVERARRSLVDLADRLGLRTGPNVKLTIDGLIGRLEAQYTPYLLVFDGVADREVLRMVPTFGGHVIMTTNAPEWAHDSTNTGIEVPDFTVAEAIAFLRGRDRSLTEAQAENVISKIGRLPLALEHLAALRLAPGLSWDELLERIDGSAAHATYDGQCSPYPPKVLASIEVALAAFANANPVAMLILELFAWFGSEPVSILLLRQGRADDDVSPALQRALGNPIELSRAIQTIQRYGLARLHADQRIEVQPVTRSALRYVLGAEALERARRNTHLILAAADQGNPNDVVSTGMHQEIDAHVVPTELVTASSARARSTVYHQVRYRYLVGDHPGACSLAEAAVAAWDADPAPDPTQELVLRTTHEWANALRALGRYQQARELTSDAMTRLRFDPAYGDEHPLTLSMSSSHASDLRIAGEYGRALEIDRETLSRCERRTGPADEQTTKVRNNLAVSLRHVGDFVPAEAADRITLEFYRNRYGLDDWRTLLSVSGLAEDLNGLGRYAEVLDLLRSYTTASHRPAGLLNRGAWLFRRALALAHRGLGDLEKAHDLLRDYYQDCNAAFGADHEYTLAATVSYANTLRLGGAAAEAYVHASDAVLAYTRTFGHRNPLTLAAEVNLAAIQRALGNRSLARRTDAVASEALRDTLGERHPFTIAAIANLATDYVLANEHPAAVRLLSERAHAAACEVHGAEHPETLSIAANLVLDLAAVGDPGAASTLREQVLIRMRQSLGASHPMIADMEQGRRMECVLEPPST